MTIFLCYLGSFWRIAEYFGVVIAALAVVFLVQGFFTKTRR